MKTFIRIVSGKNGAEVEGKVNGIAQEQGVEIVNANSFMWQGVIYNSDFCGEAKGKGKRQERGGVMEVWVRSQDKEILANVKSVRFCIMKKCDLKAEPNTMAEFIASADAYCVKCNGEFFGEYATKERCLEIIDEIQSLFCDFLICKDISPCDHPQFQKLGLTSIHYLGKDFDPKVEYHERSSIVYEMPKE